VGPEQTEVKLGEWVLIEHGRWTRGIEVENDDGSITTIRKIDNDCILAMADEQPSEF
jgi:hypothetical protein